MEKNIAGKGTGHVEAPVKTDMWPVPKTRRSLSELEYKGQEGVWEAEGWKARQSHPRQALVANGKILSVIHRATESPVSFK